MFVAHLLSMFIVLFIVILIFMFAVYFISRCFGGKMSGDEFKRILKKVILTFVFIFFFLFLLTTCTI